MKPTNRFPEYETYWYSSAGGVSSFRLTPEQGVEWIQYCRKLQRKATRQDMENFMANQK